MHDAGDVPRPGTAPRKRGLALGTLLVKYGVLGILLLLIVFLAIAAPAFLTFANWRYLLQDMSVATLVALGVTISVVVNGFDVSVGANAGLVVVVTIMSMVFWQLPTALVVLLAVATGLLVGLVNSGLVVRLRLPDLLATLAMLFVLDGGQQILAGGQTISQNMTLANGELAPGKIHAAFLAISRGSFLDVPNPVWIMVAIALALWLFLEKTRWGRILYAVGSNPEAARLAGASVGWYRTVAYLASGVLAALGGLLLSSRLGIGTQLAGDSYMLSGVAATMIGFAVLGVGRANALGTVVGALMMAVISNGFTMLNVPYYTQQTIFGVLTLVALGLSFVVRKR